ncbi:MAG: rRNA maturation RNase YbeY [Lachnospiraceae bacterium]|nr:rRNA maturation RNase YbeY [Lachnospiraceae bacterium]
MTFCVESETDKTLPFDVEEIAKKVISEALASEDCPYEASVSLLLTDDAGIHAMNHEFRGIDMPTDVLSFPNVDYDRPADFSGLEDKAEDYFEPESGELFLGDIVINVDRVYSQASEYGHSLLREYAFLTAHSMLHLLGYDHMTPKEAEEMEQKQEAILSGLGITRELCE